MTPVSANAAIDQYIRARFPIIAINSHEEARVLQAVEGIVRLQNQRGSSSRTARRIAIWSITKGLTGVDGVEPTDYINPPSVLSYIAAFDEQTPHLFILLDTHNIIKNDVQAIRLMRDIFMQFSSRQHNVILISPALTVPADLEKAIVVIDYPLPDTNELDGILANAEQSFASMTEVAITNRNAIIDAMRGLTATEASSVLKMAVVQSRRLDDEAVKVILEEKKQAVKKTGVLEIVDTKVGMDAVGGLSHLKHYAAVKHAAFSPEAKAAGVDTPKGLLMVGLPGTGKSLMAKAWAGENTLLLRFDAGKLFSRGTVGEASANMRQVIKVIEAVAPCAVWMDEIEKGFADNGGKSDGGEMMRALGTFLTWMQETAAPVYMLATANDVTGLRPELLRRFDDIIFADLPNASARLDILNVHLTKRGYKMTAAKLADVVGATWGFSGAEIEKVVKTAIENAYFSKEKLTPAHLLTAAEGIVPVSVTMKDTIESIRRWAVGRTIPADNPLEVNPRAQAENEAKVSLIEM